MQLIQTNKLIGLLLALLVLEFLSTNLSDQNPFRILNKATKLFDKGKHERALQKTDYAETISYGTCGLCAIQLKQEANILRYKIHSDSRKFRQARQVLDSAKR